MKKAEIFITNDELISEKIYKAQIIFKKTIFGTYKIVKNRTGIEPKYFVVN